MVATRDNMTNVEFVLNGDQISRADLTGKEWLEILRTELKDLPLNYLAGFQSIHDILRRMGGVSGPRRVVSSELIRSNLPENVFPNSVFLPIWDSSPDFMAVRNAPEKVRRGQEELLCHMPHQYLLLTRKGEFYLLSSVWKPRLEWDESRSLMHLSEIWYESVALALRIAPDSILELLLAQDSGATGESVRRRLETALGTAVHALERRASRVAQAYSLFLARSARIRNYIPEVT